jgi:hypothetical protein
MAKQMKDPNSLAQKYATRASAAAQDYANGVASTTGQAAAAAAAVNTWAASVADPGAQKRFVANLNKAGDAAWQNGVKTKGAGRYSQGVQAAASKWATNVGPFFSAISSAMGTMPARGLRGSAANVQRVQVIDQALHSAKLAQSGG